MDLLEDCSKILNGRILYLCLKNFMCHDYFEITFNEKINFICGPNGSGKSAIMSAIMLILGGKATHTSRASSVKEFIKEGKRSAEIIIHLKNNEQPSCKPEIFGDKIVIQKIFNLNGSIYHKIYAANQKTIVSTKAKDIQIICNKLNIQASNPILLLTQDMSRTFFHNSTPKKLYEAVNQALKLDDISDTHNVAKEIMKNTENVYNSETQSLRDCEEDILQIEKQLKKYELLKSLQAKIATMQEELKWVEYNQAQNDISNMKHKIKEEEDSLSKILGRKDALNLEYSQNDKHNKDMAAQVIEMSRLSQEMKTDHEMMLAENKRFKTAEKEIIIKINTITNQIKNATQEKETLKNTVFEITQNDLGGRKEAERAEKIKKLRLMKDKLETKASMKKTHTMDSNNFENGMNHEKQQHQKIALDLNYVNDSLKRKQGEIRDVSNSQKDSASIYGEFVPRLLQAIEEAFRSKRFSRKPKGPIGLFIKLQNEKAALALENCTKKVLRNFICHSREDANVLQEIMNSHCPRNFSPTISIFKYQDHVYDITKYLNTYTNAYNFTDLIQIDDVDVFNYVMDQIKLESVLFWEETEDVAKVFSGNQRPTNCSEAYAFNGDQYQYRDNSLSTYPCTFSRPKFLALDQSSALRQLKGEIKGLEDRRTHLTADKGRVAKEIEKLKGMKTKSDTQIAALIKECEALEKRISEIEDYFAQEDPTADSLESDLDSLNAEIAACESKMAAASADKIVLEQTLTSEIRNGLRGTKGKMEVLEARAAAIRVEYRDIERALALAREKSNCLKNEMSNVDRCTKGGEAQIHDLNSRLREAVRVCQEKFPQETYEMARVVKRYRSREEILAGIEEVRRQIDKTREEVSGMTQEQCQIAYQTKKLKIQDFKKKSHEFRKCHKDLLKQMEQHQVGFQNFQKNIHSRIAAFFSFYMKHRNFMSKLRVDVPNKEIIIHVKPDKNLEYSTDLKALSGGERSYTSICFLLSLWSCINTPFICLDEFDVFMDLLNREIGKELIIYNAKQTNSSQMIILTPLDIGNVEASDEVSVWKLDAPERS